MRGGQERGNYERRDFVAVGGWSVGSHGRTGSGPSGFRAMVYSGIRVRAFWALGHVGLRVQGIRVLGLYGLRVFGPYGVGASGYYGRVFGYNGIRALGIRV